MSTFPTSSTTISWDPLAPLESERPDEGILFAAQRREIRNILKSYTGYYDLFAEMLQNALDAVEKQKSIDPSHEGKIWITINLNESSVSVTDNGCGMAESQFKQFLRPNFSFKDGQNTRGCKGVGTTYLAYGFNHLEIATKFDDKIFSGRIMNGRKWVEDNTDTIARPKVEFSTPTHEPFSTVNSGTSIVVKLTGESIRPKNLKWLSATNAEQWMAVLQVNTPIGGIYLDGGEPPVIDIEVEVINGGNITSKQLASPQYLFPHEAIKNCANLKDFLADQALRVQQKKDLNVVPPKYTKRNGIWIQWNAADILDKDNKSIAPKLDPDEIALLKDLNASIYVFLTYSTEVWDRYNDDKIGLRKGHRLLSGGLQLSTRNMPQGSKITIPLTRSTGFQQISHVVIHMENCEPDLGRKGFQPDQTHLAEKLSVAAVNAVHKFYDRMLKKPGAAKEYGDEKELDDWIKSQEKHEENYPVSIKGSYLFCPSEELPIKSEPLVEQDVVALFNQMLSSGIVRGIQLISSSQYKQYDGLFRINMEEPFDRYILSNINPLGIPEDFFSGGKSYGSKVKVIEYKFTLDGLIEEIQSELKNSHDISIIVAWEMGDKWQQLFDIVSLLDESNHHHRTIHGVTHRFTHTGNGEFAFDAVILKDLISYLADPEAESKRQSELYDGDEF